MKLLENIFSIKNDSRCHKVITVLGLKFKIKNKNLQLKRQIKDLELKYTALINTIIDDNYIYLSKGFSLEEALKNKYVSSTEEYYQNLDNLTHNLDKDALANFNKIYERILLAEKYDKVPLHKIFSPYEINEIRKANNLKLLVKDNGDFYQYKNYKLPFNRFDYAIFEKKQCIPHIKTLDQIGDKVIIDAGGLCGDTALVFREFTDAPIITFEPVNKHYEYCCKTRELNSIKNYKIENLALGDQTITTDIYVNLDIPGASSLLESNNKCNIQKQKCQIITLDEYVEQNNIQVGLIKTDVEGFEFSLLQGAINTITTQKPILLISIYHNYHDFFKIKPWLENLNLGYKFNFVKDMDEYYNLDIYLIAEPENGMAVGRESNPSKGQKIKKGCIENE